ncbi:MAG TPA: rhodanese-like domain-containing protein [Pyrinomonadaceae bacterium]|jgi:rhodanese-related sulfurtransferase|nr:rhodanese-like domain-containing protein [Pyrinomonadaceae bacterium]
MADIKIISTVELEQQLREGGKLEFWNVLTDEYFNGEMIPGSRRVPLERVGREARETNLAKDAEIIVYCAGPQCPQSGYAARKLEDLGYTNVKAYEGGLEEWKGLGREVERVGEPVAA